MRGKVGAGAKGPALAVEHRDRERLVRLERGKRRAQRPRHRPVDGVALLRPVDNDGRDRAVVLDADRGMPAHASSSANGSPSKQSTPRPIAAIAALMRPRRPSLCVGERDEALVRRRGRGGRAQGARDLVFVAVRRQRAGDDEGRGGRTRDAGEAMDQHRLNTIPALDEFDQRIDVLEFRQHLSRRRLDDVRHRDVEVAFGRNRRRALDDRARTEQASPSNARRSWRRSPRCGRANRRAGGASGPQMRGVKVGEARQKLLLRLVRPPRTQIRVYDVGGNFGRAKEFSRLVDRKARKLASPRKRPTAGPPP